MKHKHKTKRIELDTAPAPMPVVKLRHDDSLHRLRKVRDNTFHSMVTDPPSSAMVFGNKSKWDDDKGGKKQWIAWLQAIMAEAYRTLCPGAYGVVWSLPRTQHLTATALENAGFEIVDVVVHLFPRSLIKGQDASKALDGYLGLPRKTVGLNKNARTPNTGGAGFVYNSAKYDTISTEDVSVPWEGWRSNLKPAAESWILVRKPLEGNVAENILGYGTGGVFVGKKNVDKIQSNVVLSHDQECTKHKCIRSCLIRKLLKQNPNALNYFKVLKPVPEKYGTQFLVDDKIGRKERGNLRHPTIKTQKLMKFLVGLVTPPGGDVLDPFMGSGSTAVAAISLGRGFYGVEKGDEQFQEARQRITSCLNNVTNTGKSRKQ